MKKVRVLLLLDSAWNDEIFGNNNMTNWFSGMENVEFANIYCSNEMPKNSCCEKYLQITDEMMIKSVFSKEKAGRIISQQDYSKSEEAVSYQESNVLSSIKGIRTDFFRFCRDILWIKGVYNEELIKSFIDGFCPDIIFSIRLASVKMCRLEGVVKRIANCPLIAFTGDKEFSVHELNFSPFSWIRQIMQRRALFNRIKDYSLYYTNSRDQAKYYRDRFGVKTKLLFKCAISNEERIHHQVNNPIKIVYAGKLYCGRWKTLSMLVEKIRLINDENVKIFLEIYSTDSLNGKQKKILDDRRNSFYMGAIAPSKIQSVYDSADLALHVEAFDYRNRSATQFSYSTKILDCLSSGCALMAIAWERHSACVELKESDAAFVITNEEDCISVLRKITSDSDSILTYSRKAMACVKTEHDRNDIQFALYQDFVSCIQDENI